MENKHNFMGIIIPVVIAVILLTVLPILTNMSTECPPCAECPPCEEMPTLYTPTISISSDTLTITQNTNNGAFVTGYKIYVDDIILDTTTSTTYDLSNELTEVDTYEIYVTAYATSFTDSEHSNTEYYVVEPEPVGKTLTLDFTSSGFKLNDYYERIDLIKYMINSTNNWVTIDYPFSNLVLNDVLTIKFNFKNTDTYYSDRIKVGSSIDYDDIFINDDGAESDTINITQDSTFYISYFDD